MVFCNILSVISLASQPGILKSGAVFTNEDEPPGFPEAGDPTGRGSTFFTCKIVLVSLCAARDRLAGFAGAALTNQNIWSIL
jgi:hypothetical protein